MTPSFLLEVSLIYASCAMNVENLNVENPRENILTLECSKVQRILVQYLNK